jgi:hypothetical protein
MNSFSFHSLIDTVQIIFPTLRNSPQWFWKSIFSRISFNESENESQELVFKRISTILAKTNETSSLINNLIYSSPLPMLIKMSKKPTHSALCHRWTIVHIFYNLCPTLCRGEGILSVLLIFYRCFINFLPRLSEKDLNTNISPWQLFTVTMLVLKYSLAECLIINYTNFWIGWLILGCHGNHYIYNIYI